MMRNGENYAIAVRKSDGSIVLKKEKYRGILADSPLKKIPFLRGVFVFIDSMILGLRCTDYSASIYAEDDPEDEKAGAENAIFILKSCKTESIIKSGMSIPQPANLYPGDAYVEHSF